MDHTLYPAVQQALEQVNRVILGKSEEIKEVMTAFLANGHVLLEDIPGVGKTTLAIAFSKAMQLDYRRIQFTPDVLPSDLTGFSVYRREEEKFVYQQGGVFCNLLPSRLYCRFWNCTKSCAGALADYTADREFHPALKTSVRLSPL